MRLSEGLPFRAIGGFRRRTFLCCLPILRFALNTAFFSIFCASAASAAPVMRPERTQVRPDAHSGLLPCICIKLSKKRICSGCLPICCANTAGCPSFCPEGQYARGAAMFSLRCEHTPRFFRYYAQLRRSVGVFGDFSAICRRQSACTRTIMKSPSDLTVTGICVDFPSSPATTKLSFAPLGRFRKMYGKSPKRMSEPSAIEVR